VAPYVLSSDPVLLVCWLAFQLPMGILVGKLLKSRVPPAI
jgi:hypothetical protein